MNTAVVAAPEVEVVDASGNPISGVTLTFTVTGGGGSVGSGTVTSNGAGDASTSYTLGTVAGASNNTMTVAGQTALPGTAGPASLTFTESALVGAPAKLYWSTPLTQLYVNQCVPLQIGIEDQYGNTATVIGAPDTVTFTATGSGVYYSDSSCTVPSATNTIGVGSSTTPTMYYTDGTPEIATLSATSAPLTAAPNQSVSSKLELYITSYNGGVLNFTAGTCISFTVTAEDFKGMTMAVPADSAFNFGNSAGNSAIYSDNICSMPTSPTLLSGQNTMTLYTTDLRAETFNPYALAEDTYLTVGSNLGNVTVNPGPSSVLVVTGPTYVTPGSCGGPFTVTSTDGDNNPSLVTGAALSVGLSATGSALLYGDSGCGTAPPSSIAVNSDSLVFYARDAATEFSTLTASAATYTSGTFNMDSNAVSNLQAVAVGGSFSCALISGGAKCWGNNSTGQLGNGTTMSSLTSVSVSGLNAGVQSIVAESPGGDYGTACALKTDGSVWCWGYNAYSQVGNGTLTNQLTPVNVFNGAAQISGNDMESCAVTSAGALYCWGYGGYGQIGISPPSFYNTTPQEVLSSGVISVSVGYRMACAVLSGGDLYCWGSNFGGDVGNGNSTEQDIPVQVSGLTSGISAVANAYSESTCAIDPSGAVLCWGTNVNGQGQLGNGSLAGSSLTPIASLIISGGQAITAGAGYFCALLSGGALSCWGENYYGNLGDGGTVSTGTPQTIFSSGVGTVSAETDSSTTCAIVSGNLMCWGQGNFGQLGTRLTGDSSLPVFTGSLE